MSNPLNLKQTSKKDLAKKPLEKLRQSAHSIQQWSQCALWSPMEPSRRKSPFISPQSLPWLIEDFRSLTRRFCQILESVGIEQAAHGTEGPQYFAKLPPEQQIATIANFHRYLQVVESELSLGVTPHQESQLLWSMLSRLKLRPNSDLFRQVKDDDIVEIYETAGFVQVYRSLRFFKVCSYDLDDILCRPWYELYERDSSVTSKIFQTVSLASKPGNQSSIAYDLGPQELREVDSKNNFHWLQEMRLVSPLFDKTKHITAVVNIVKPMERLEP